VTELHEALRAVVDVHGAELLTDAQVFRGALDDVLEEHVATAGDINLLADAVRFGAVPAFLEMTDGGAAPEVAAVAVGSRVARERGGADPLATSWAVAVLAYALRRTSEDVVARFRSTPVPSEVWPAPHRPLPAEITIGAPGHSGAVETPTVAPRATSGTGAHVVQRRSRSGPLLGVGAVLLVVAAAVAGVAWVGDDLWDSDRAPQVRPDGGEKASVKHASVSAAPSEPTSNGDASEAFVCWDQETEVARLGQCPAPAGEAGMSWVFPQAADCAGRYTEQLKPPVRLFEIHCLPAPGVKIHFSHWTSHSEASAYYAAECPEMVGPWRGLMLRYQCGSEGHPYAFKQALLYLDESAPWSVTVYSDSSTALLTTLRDLQVRMPQDLRGVPTA